MYQISFLYLSRMRKCVYVCMCARARQYHKWFSSSLLRSLLQLLLMLFFAGRSGIRPDAISSGYDSTGVQPGQTNTDLSRLCLEENGFRVKRVALAAMGILFVYRGQQVSPASSTFPHGSFRFYFDITSVTHFRQLSTLKHSSQGLIEPSIFYGIFLSNW